LRISFCKTFSQLIDKNDLPATIRRTLEGKETAEEQDKIILADLNLLAIAEPNVYGMVSGDFRVEEKNRHSFVIPFAQSPKFVLATNFTLSRHDPSTARYVQTNCSMPIIRTLAITVHRNLSQNT